MVLFSATGYGNLQITSVAGWTFGIHIGTGAISEIYFFTLHFRCCLLVLIGALKAYRSDWQNLRSVLLQYVSRGRSRHGGIVVLNIGFLFNRIYPRDYSFVPMCSTLFNQKFLLRLFLSIPARPRLDH
jgi:hypothetical protein